MIDVEAFRQRVMRLRQELAVAPKVERVRGEPVTYQRRVRGVVVEEVTARPAELIERELAEAEAELTAAQEAAARAFEQQEQRERIERDRRQRAARERLREADAKAAEAEARYVAALVDLDELISASPVGRMFDALADLNVAKQAFQQALAPLVGNVLLDSPAGTELVELLDELGEEADAVRRALDEGHPARLPPNTRPQPSLRYGALIHRLFSIPDRRK